MQKRKANTQLMVAELVDLGLMCCSHDDIAHAQSSDCSQFSCSSHG